MTCPMPDDVCEHCGYRCCDSVSDGSPEGVKTQSGLIEDDSATAQAGTPSPSPLLTDTGVEEMKVELLGWHDCLDGSGPGNGRFEIYMENGEAEQTRLNFRACLRESASLLTSLQDALAEAQGAYRHKDELHRYALERLETAQSQLAEKDREIERLKAERDATAENELKLFRRVQELEEKNVWLEEEARGRRRWLADAKEARGYSENVSFDTVWAETCAKADELTTLQNRLQEVEGALEEIAREAAEEIEAWGAYADAYFQEKHDLQGTVQKFRARASLHPKGESK